MTKKYVLLLVFVSLLTIFVIGCGDDYDIENDTEFHAALDKVIENVLKGEDAEVAFDNLFNEFSDRYSDEEMDEFSLEQWTVAENKLNEKLSEIQERQKYIESSIEDYIGEIETITDRAVYDLFNNQVKYTDEKSNELLEKIDESNSIYEKIELQEELLSAMDDLLGMLEAEFGY